MLYLFVTADQRHPTTQPAPRASAPLGWDVGSNHPRTFSISPHGSNSVSFVTKRCRRSIHGFEPSLSARVHPCRRSLRSSVKSAKGLTLRSFCDMMDVSTPVGFGPLWQSSSSETEQSQCSRVLADTVGIPARVTVTIMPVQASHTPATPLFCLQH